MFSIFTKKSLFVSAALILAIACTGIAVASAHTGIPVKKKVVSPPPQQGIPAITPPRGHSGLLGILDVVHYLDGQGFVGGPTRNGSSPGIQGLHLTTVGALNDLQHIFVPGAPRNQKVYYTQLKGPFTLSPKIGQPVLNTLLPARNNASALNTLLPGVGKTLGLNASNNSGLLGSLFGANDPPYNQNSLQTNQNQAPNGGQSGLNNLNNTSKGNQQRSSKLPTNKLSKGSSTSQGKLTKNAPHSLGKLSNTRRSGVGAVLQTVYEIFDAHTGNLLAWG